MTSRRRFFGLLAGLPFAGALAAPASAMTGRHAGPVTDHFDGERFFNPGGSGPRGFGDFLRWQVSGNRTPWPDRFESPFADRPPARVQGGEMRVSLVGHATFLIQTGGLNILTDPVWSERASPVAFAGPKRVNAPGIAFNALPRIDAVLISHNHYDHLDVLTLARLWRRDRPRLVAPLGNAGIILGGIPDAAVTSVDWGDGVALKGSVTVVAEPAHHWSARGIGDRNRMLWASYVVRGPRRTAYFAGDTGFGGGRNFEALAARHPRIDLALLPIGAYEPRWFMQAQHMNPDDAVRAFGILAPKRAVGFHWGTFQLTDEGIEAPARDLERALARAGIDAARFPAGRPGQVFQA